MLENTVHNDLTLNLEINREHYLRAGRNLQTQNKKFPLEISTV